MPYIKPENRSKFDQTVDWMALECINIEHLHDILFVFCKNSVKPSYNNYKNFIGELRQCAAEIERRKLVSQKCCKFEVFPKRKPNLQTILAIAKLMIDLDVKADGDLNYILFKFCKYHIVARKKFCRMLRKLAKEIEKDLLAPYEDEKIAENGDV